MARKASTSGHRPHAVHKRVIPKTARFNAPEFVDVVVAAEREHLAVGAWIAKAAVEVARAHNNPRRVAAKEIAHELVRLRLELAQLRRISVLHGNNLNQLAAAANTTGEVGAAAPRVISNIDQVVVRAVEHLAVVDTLLARITDRFEG